MRYWVVDAFTKVPLGGNPAAVVHVEDGFDQAWAQRVAAEFNLSETAFVWPIRGATMGLRWFTPAAEVELCGHGTLASAHAMWEAGVVPLDVSITFETRFRGELRCQREPSGWIEMDFPADVPVACAAPDGLLAALGLAAGAVSRSRYDYVVEVDAPAVVRGLRPDFVGLNVFDMRGVMVTAGGDTATGADFVSRFFAPRLRIAEDPVTGSAHCVLGPHWAARLDKSGPLLGYQASPRGGFVRCDPQGDRVRLAGEAVVVAEGRWLAT